MALGIGASDRVIKEKPDLVRAIVKAAMRGMKNIMDDPDKAADDFVKFVPEWKGKDGSVKATFNYYTRVVYPGQWCLERSRKAAGFYHAKGLIQRKSPVADLYTDAFIR